MFVKNDESFICKNCGHKVPRLEYTSRDHCNKCLYSLHIDITPGDRQNTCLGMLKPINVIMSSKKEQIEYICMSCGSVVKNVVAIDDDRDELLRVTRNYAKFGGDIHGRNQTKYNR